MTSHTLKISSDKVRNKASMWLAKFPSGGIIQFNPKPTRTTEQNAKMWAMLGDVANQVEHAGKYHTPDVWKCIFLNALGHETIFIEGIDGEIFPMGLRSSKLSVKQMADLIELIYKHGAEKGVKWTEKGFSHE